MEEMRRLGSGTMPTSGPARRSAAAPAADVAKRPLAERINDPRVARLVRQENDETPAADGNAGAGEPRRVSGFLKALDAASGETRVEHASDGESPQTDAGTPGTEIKRTRKARLLDRITGLDKNSA